MAARTAAWPRGLVGRIADNVTAARVLVYDVETRPLVAMSWQARGDMYLGPDQLFDAGGVMAWSARWLDESKIRWSSDHHDGHADMVGGLYELLQSANVVMGFNHERFDNPSMATEFDELDLPRLAPVPQIDLLKVCRSNFKLPHYKLGYLASRFGLTDKVSNDGWKLWRACITDPETGYPYLGPIPQGGGCPKSWGAMKRYGRQDTGTTTELYWYLRRGGWIKKHPHAGLLGGDPNGCPACGSKSRTAIADHLSTTARYPAFRCDDCQQVYRLTRSVPRSTTGTRAI